MKKIGIVLFILIFLTSTLLGCGKQDFSSLCRKVRYNYISETNWKLSNWNVKGGTCEWKKLE